MVKIDPSGVIVMLGEEIRTGIVCKFCQLRTLYSQYVFKGA